MTQNIVTRFAPSPTGYLHIGGARTALFCWLLARKHQGRFILRIEDTDQKRNTPTAAQQVMDDLHWLGLDWDEGPDVGGPNGPYKQSERLELYDKYIQQLLDAGKAYYCFDTPDELQALRVTAQKEKRNFIYPRPAAFPDASDVQKARAAGRPVTVRFCMPDEPVVVNDIVRDEVTFQPGEFSDIIIRKSDGYPTYHLACVIDDALMDITHVIRGQEHLMNTPAHQAMQTALGLAVPAYAHISVTVSESGGKLSKRDRAKTVKKHLKDHPNYDQAALLGAGKINEDNLSAFLKNDKSPDTPTLTAMAEFLGLRLPEINLIDFFQSGYLPEAMVNFTAILGWNPGDNREIMPKEDLIEAFSLDRLSKTNSLFDRKKLVAFNTEHFKMIDPQTRLGHFQKFLKSKNSPLTTLDDAALFHLLQINEGAQTLQQVENKCLFLMRDQYDYDPKAVAKTLQKDSAPKLLADTRTALAELDPWQPELIHELIKVQAEKQDVGMGKIAQPLRVAITGTTISPPIQDSLWLLGKEKTIQRIERTLHYLREG